MDGPQGWSDLFHEISQLMQSSSRTANEEYIEYVLERLSICIRSVTTIKCQVEDEVDGDSSHVLFRICQLLSDIVSRLQTLRRQWSEQLNNLASCFNFHYQAPKTSGIASLGRPRYKIYNTCSAGLPPFIIFLLDRDYSLAGGVKNECDRRRVEYGLMEEPSHTLTDDDLDKVVHELRVEYLRLARLWQLDVYGLWGTEYQDNSFGKDYEG